MCEIASRIETEDGKVVFLTDADVESGIADGRLESWEDGCGHHAISALYQHLHGSEREGMPCGPEYAAAIRGGSVRRILRTLGYEEAHVDAEGRWHREDGPAWIATHADVYRRESWYREGQRHREDGPAWIATRADGSRREEWYREGQRHREDGPAWIETTSDGYRREEWYREGQRHREDGPAVIETTSDVSRREEWYREGKRIESPKEGAVE